MYAGNPDGGTRHIRAPNEKLDHFGAGHHIDEKLCKSVLYRMYHGETEALFKGFPNRFFHSRMSMSQNDGTKGEYPVDILVVVHIPYMAGPAALHEYGIVSGVELCGMTGIGYSTRDNLFCLFKECF